MRAGVNGYVDAVAAAVPDIEKGAHVEMAGDDLEAFLMIVAIRRIWSTVNSQFWIMNDCIAVAMRMPEDSMGPPPTRGFRIGRDEISQGSAAVLEGRSLREDFQALIAKLDIADLVTESTSLSDVATMMFSRDR